MNLRFAIGRRLNCRSWLALTAAILVLPACGRSRNTPPDKSSFVCQAPPPSKRESFGSEMRAAMVRMHDAMDLGYSGDSDRDFATMMIPHHQGAVDMALAELRFGHHEQLRRLAAGMIVEQRSEIASMAQILAETGALERRSFDAAAGSNRASARSLEVTAEGSRQSDSARLQKNSDF